MKKSKSYLNFIISFTALLILVGCATNSKQEIKPVTEEKPSQEKEKNIPAIHNVIPEGEIELLEGFEEGNFWQARGETVSEDKSTEADITENWASEGNASALWSFSAISQEEKASFYCEGLMDSDWEGASYFIADINNQFTKPVSIYLCVYTGKTREYTRTESVFLGAGLNTNVMFNLKHGTADVNGEPVPGITDADSIKCAELVIEGKCSAGSINADNIRLLRQ